MVDEEKKARKRLHEKVSFFGLLNVTNYIEIFSKRGRNCF